MGHGWHRVPQPNPFKPITEQGTSTMEEARSAQTRADSAIAYAWSTAAVSLPAGLAAKNISTQTLKTDCCRSSRSSQADKRHESHLQTGGKWLHSLGSYSSRDRQHVATAITAGHCSKSALTSVPGCLCREICSCLHFVLLAAARLYFSTPLHTLVFDDSWSCCSSSQWCYKRQNMTRRVQSCGCKSATSL